MIRRRRALVVGPPALFSVVSVLHPRPDWPDRRRRLAGGAVATALALRGAGASRLVATLVVVSGVALAIDHPFPTVTIAMGCLLAACALWTRVRVSVR